MGEPHQKRLDGERTGSTLGRFREKRERGQLLSEFIANEPFPALTELCGLPAKPGVSGRSLTPLLREPNDATWNHPVVSMHAVRHFSVRKGDWHYILYDGKEEELYDLKNDPEEWENSAGKAEYASTIQELKAHIPQERAALVKTKPIRWAEVLSGETQFYD